MNRTTPKPVTGETVFEAASLSKPVLAYGVQKTMLAFNRSLAYCLQQHFTDNHTLYAQGTGRAVIQNSIAAVG